MCQGFVKLGIICRDLLVEMLNFLTDINFPNETCTSRIRPNELLLFEVEENCELSESRNNYITDTIICIHTLFSQLLI